MISAGLVVIQFHFPARLYVCDTSSSGDLGECAILLDEENGPRAINLCKYVDLCLRKEFFVTHHTPLMLSLFSCPF
jgi:hypothetical protein